MKKLIFCVIYVFLLQSLFAQDFTQVIPPLPDAASIMKYQFSPVSHSTGLPKIEVPIYNLKSKSLNLNISLKYHASGIKVQEEASFAGLGWSLYYGGLVTRIVKGLPDDFISGYMYSNKTIKNVMDDPDNKFDFHAALEGQFDLEPDVFSFNLPGYSGSLFYDQDTKRFIQSPNLDLRIKEVLNDGLIVGWEITNTDGVIYYFGKSKDGQRTATEKIINEITTVVDEINGPSYAGGYADNAISSWYLLDIYDPNHNDEVSFYYSSFLQSTCSRTSEVEDYNIVPSSNASCIATESRRTSFSERTSLNVQIDSIKSATDRIYFYYNNQLREDINGGKAIKEIVVKNHEDLKLNNITFRHGYFDSGVFSSVGFCRNEYRLKRLKLNSVTFNDPQEKKEPLLYEFEYNTQDILPDKLSNAQDYWGYYNGKSDNPFLLPKVTLTSSGIVYPGADRSVDQTASKACILKKIIYPTGASQEYTYENNIISNGHEISSNNSEVITNQLTRRNLRFHQDNVFFNAAMSNTTYDLYDTTFNISMTKRGLINFVVVGCIDFYSSDCDFQIYLQNLSTSDIINIDQATFSKSLSAGQYKIIAKVFGDSRGCGVLDPVLSCQGFDVLMWWNEDPLNEGPINQDFIVGSQRIKQITMNDGLGNHSTRSYEYLKFNTTEESGNLYDLPAFVSRLDCNNIQLNAILRISSQNQFSSSEGIIYTNITEYFDNKENGKIEYTYSFTNPALYISSVDMYGEYPHPPRHIRKWRDNLLLCISNYEKKDNNYRILNSTEYFYTPYHEQYFYYHGIKVGSSYGTDGGGILNLPPVDYAQYESSIDKYLLDQVKKSIYSYTDNKQNKNIHTSKYFYDNLDAHQFASRIEEINSEGRQTNTLNTYVADKMINAGAFYQDMIDKHMIGKVIEKIVSVDKKPINKVRTNYNIISDKYWLPVSVEVAPDGNNYQLQTSVEYNDQARISQVADISRINISYLWDFNQKYPVAKAVNATAADISFTSFECQAKGGWLYSGTASTHPGVAAITGQRIYTLGTGSISKSNINANSNNPYKLSFWARTESGSRSWSFMGQNVDLTTTWTLIERNVTGSSFNITGSNIYIDELRLHPLNAQMTTYSYKSGVGISSTTDPNNITNYYEYDGFRRLEKIIDKERNILKSFEYNLKDLRK